MRTIGTTAGEFSLSKEFRMPFAGASTVHLVAAIWISCCQHWNPEAVHSLPFCTAGDISDLHGVITLLSLLW
jgi:hypothetical protein